ncbi:FKBP-type peptidyl-prolyl cis-trans isomerase [Dyadobacter sp. Leaf189]|uniref:FKBP-type peptidyl-prolyl cis-trans isomerase n=1 Tax=Dyadobacter sp. Leaf189 TaxID=1736295 RepID=UPI0006F28128|nr:FKBP-type peptidyl-prolyl cis-trans isomerase [Dyadobacter sp. Leaf189]KQS25490.1 FKBP-type peptidylprolyl isomerase [Dyadobacter sp. Leaf189]
MKRTKLALFILLAMVVSLSGCMNSDKNQDEEKITENENEIKEWLKTDSLGTSALRDSTGLYYIIRKSNPSGQKAKRGEAATVRINGYLLNGTKVLSIEKDSTLSFPVDGFSTQIYGLEFGIKLMRTGEKATFLLPYYLAFGNADRVNIPAYSVIRMEVELIKMRTEIQQIDEFLAKKQFPVSERTADNLVIIRTNTVTGDTLGPGKSVSVKYVGKMLNEKEFDKNTIPITTGTNGTIPGFDRAIRKLRKTEKAIIIFPSALGYKERGSGSIPPYTPIMFEVEVLP